MTHSNRLFDSLTKGKRETLSLSGNDIPAKKTIAGIYKIIFFASLYLFSVGLISIFSIAAYIGKFSNRLLLFSLLFSTFTNLTFALMLSKAVINRGGNS